MRLRVLTLLTVLLLAHCSGGSSDGEVIAPERTEVHGTVTYADSGSPVAGVTLSIGPDVTISEPDGTYRLANIEVGERTLRANRPGYAGYEQTIDVTSAGTLHDVSLAAAATGGILSGLTFDRDTGQPLADSTVTVAGLTAVADGNGIYRFDSVPQGTHEIIGLHEGYLGAIGAVYISAGDREFSLGMFYAHCFEANWYEGTWQDYELPGSIGSCRYSLLNEFACDCSNDPCVYPRDRVQCLFQQSDNRWYCADYDPLSRTISRSSQYCTIDVEFLSGTSATVRWRNTAGTEMGQYPGEPQTSPTPADLAIGCN